MAITSELSSKLRDKLADALAKCDCAGTPTKRDSLIRDLPREVREAVKRADDIKTDVGAILYACSKFPNGLYDLRDAVLGLEGANFDGQNFCVAFAEVEVLFHCPTGETALSKLTKILHSIDLPGGEIAALCALYAKQSAAIPAQLYAVFLESAGRFPAKGFDLLEQLLRLLEKNDVPQARELRDWMKQSASQFGVEAATLAEFRERIKWEAQSAAYVVVKIVENQLLDDTFYVEAWSWRRDEKFQRLEIKSRLAAEDHHKFPAIETLLRAAICEVEETLAAPSFVVELVTERKVFAKDISGWKVDVGEDEGNLLIHYPVVLRWKNRHERFARHRRHWPKKWNALKEHSSQPGLHGLKWLSCETACSHSEILDGWIDAHNSVCLALGYQPSDEEGSEDLLKAALNVGTPVVFWLQRTCDGEAISEEYFRKLLGESKLIDLPTHIWELRKQAHTNPDHPARRLALLFDDADRVLPRIGQHT